MRAVLLLANAAGGGIGEWMGKTLSECLEWLKAAEAAGLIEKGS